MLVAGEYQSLRIARIADPGIYLTDEEGNEVIKGIVKPYDMRKINKEYLVLPPAEEEEPTEVKAIQPKKPIQLNAKQAELLKKSTIRSMYKK